MHIQSLGEVQGALLTHFCEIITSLLILRVTLLVIPTVCRTTLRERPAGSGPSSVWAMKWVQL